MNTKLLIASTALAAMLAIAPASAQLIGGGGGLTGNAGGAIGGATGSIGGNLSGAGAIGADTSAVDRATQRAEREARQAAREARRAARQAEEQATQARDVQVGGSGAVGGALNAGPLSAEGNGSADSAADFGVDPGQTTSRVADAGRSSASRARNAADSSAERARGAIPNASVDGEASGSASADRDGASANGSARTAAHRQPD